MNGSILAGSLCNTLPRTRHNFRAQVISTFKTGCPDLTLKEGSKVKSDHIRKFPAHDFL